MPRVRPYVCPPSPTETQAETSFSSSVTHGLLELSAITAQGISGSPGQALLASSRRSALWSLISAVSAAAGWPRALAELELSNPVTFRGRELLTV